MYDLSIATDDNLFAGSCFRPGVPGAEILANFLPNFKLTRQMGGQVGTPRTEMRPCPSGLLASTQLQHFAMHFGFKLHNVAPPPSFQRHLPYSPAGRRSVLCTFFYRRATQDHTVNYPEGFGVYREWCLKKPRSRAENSGDTRALQMGTSLTRHTQTCHTTSLPPEKYYLKARGSAELGTPVMTRY
ncbi:LOW QUALITY PROTEIN: hypothetical protein T265_14521 [Opisthorchis viverrini]|uniref:Uncharacterized protein n=1 Tax=Opisthorchis viverrini TaxID=6198 RepID=A0A074ZE98_OPIVI|nr:LOW QUALITY PROTEIN: hypothetical protein T265_14521 [Opisthorchis viverrini]KER23982.1 LOW QUALITY PROTEIN: hypothetical protein T265_14521 [Opisthorchis viverrini]